jgi:hypothetical protein
MDRGDDVDFGGGGVPGFGLGLWCGWVLVVVVFLVGVAGLVFGVGEAGVDGVVQVEALSSVRCPEPAEGVEVCRDVAGGGPVDH